MSTTINYYRQWLELRGDRPKTHYHLLGLPLLEGDPLKIKQAANRIRTKIEQHRGQGHDAAVDRLIDELDAAELCLLDSQRKAKYDQKLRKKLAQQGKLPGKAAKPASGPSQAGTSQAAPAGPSAAKPATPVAADDDEDSVELLPPGADEGDSASVDLPAALTPGHFPGGTSAQPGPPPAAPVDQVYTPGYPSSPQPVAPVPPPPPAPPAPPASAGYAQEPPMPGDVPRAQLVEGPGVVPRATPVSPVPPSGPPAPPVTPVAQVAPVTPIAQVAPVAQVTPVSPVSQGPLGGPIVSTPSPRSGFRRRKPTGLLIGGGVGIVAALLLVLMIVTETGPFAPAEPTTVANRGTASISNPPVTPTRSTPRTAQPTPATVPPATPPQTTPPQTTPTPPPQPTPMPPMGQMAPPDSQPTPTPQPAPTPTPPAPQPTPPSEPAPMPQGKSDPAAVAAVDHALMGARYYLATRELEQADKQLALAQEKLAAAPDKRADYLRVKSLAHYVKAFWQSVRDSAQSLGSGEQITIAGITVGVVEVTPESITLRQSGQNITHYYREMKTGLAVGLANRVLREGDPAAELILGAFKAVNPTSDRAEARTHWQTAQRLGAGEQATELMPELDIAVPESFDPDAAPMVASIPMPMPSPTPTPTPTPMPAPQGRYPMPPASALNKLISDLRSARQEDFAAARSAEQMVALAGKLQAEAEGRADDPSARLVLLAAARDLAAQAYDFSLAYQVVEQIAETHEADTLDMRSAVLALAGRSADTAETAGQVVDQALALSDEARLALRYNEALSILRNAQVIARKSRDAELLQTVSQRLDETTEERKLGR